MFDLTDEEFAQMRGRNLSDMLCVLKPRNVTDLVTMRPLMPTIVCADGTTLSVQASEHHYCRPRSHSGPYTHVEVGSPSSEVPHSWLDYAENRDKPCGTVYGCLPIELVYFYIGAHGGIDYDKTLKRG